jgi:hypothetical protein
VIASSTSSATSPSGRGENEPPKRVLCSSDRVGDLSSIAARNAGTAAAPRSTSRSNARRACGGDGNGDRVRHWTKPPQVIGDR